MNNLKVVVSVHPFTLEQEFIVLKDGQQVESLKAPMENFSDVIYTLKNKYNANEIDLCGNKDYLSRFQAELQTKFGLNDVIVKII